MSSNIYEDPNLSANFGFSKSVRGDGGERLERIVDIYEVGDVFTERRDGGEQPKTHLPALERKLYKAALLSLSLICVMCLVGVGVLYKLSFLKDQQHRGEIAKMKSGDKNQTTGLELCPSNWTRFRCNCYFTSTETRNWTESRRDCESRGAELVVIQNKEEQDFIKEKLQRRGDSWIGLQVVTKEWREEWQWVDGNPIKYTSWKKDVSVTPVKHHKVYIAGQWMHTNNGSRYWICQRPIF